MMYLIENTFSLKKYKPRVMRLQGFMGIRSLAKQIQSSFNKSSDTIGPFIRAYCHELLVRMKSPEYFVLSLPLSFYFFQDESFQVLSYDFQMATLF